MNTTEISAQIKAEALSFWDWFIGLDYVHFILVDLSLWCAFGLISHMLLTCLVKKYRTYPKFEDQMEFLNYFGSLFNAVMSIYIGYWAMFKSCDGWENGVNMFNSETCIKNAKPIHIKICLNTGSYMLVDYILFAILAKQKGPLATQIKIHHILSVIIFYATIETESAPAAFGCMA